MLYYSRSRKQWVSPSTMHDVHLVNALARGVTSVNESDSLKAEILRRMVTGPAPVHVPGPSVGHVAIPAGSSVTVVVNGVTVTVTR